MVKYRCCHGLRKSRRYVCRGRPHHGFAASRCNPQLNESNPLLLMMMMMMTAGDLVPWVTPLEAEQQMMPLTTERPPPSDPTSDPSRFER